MPNSPMSSFHRVLCWLSGRLSLRLTLVLIVVLPLAVSMGLTSYVVLSAFEEYTERRMEEDVELVARSLRMPIGRALQRDREGAVQEALRSAFSFNRVYGAYLYDEEGRLTAAVGSANLSADSSQLSKLAEDGTETGEYDEVAGRSVYSYFAPLSTPMGQNIGLLQVVRRAREIDQAVASLRWTAAVVFFVTLGLASGLVLWGHRLTIGEPLEQLRRDMTKAEAGSRSHRATPRGPTEVAALSQQFNTMIESVEQAEHEIRTREAEQRRLEKKLKHTEKLAALGQLSAGVAHELGTPLSVIDGKAQRALRFESLPDRVEDALHTVRTEVGRMEHIVRQLLDFGRRNPLQRRTVPGHRLVEMAIRSTQAAHPDADRVKKQPPPPPVSLSVDVGLAERVLANLLQNAIEAAPNGMVRLSWEEEGTDVVFRVEDSGPGIDPEVKPRLFEPFFTTKGVGKGTGLGLAVAHGIVEEHGGTVEVSESALGGACFEVRLPQSPPPDAAPDHPREAGDAPSL